MEFNEEKAIEIIKKFDLDEKTIRVWRSRKSIPDKYADKDYKPRVQISNVKSVKHERVIDVLMSGFIVRSNFAQLIDISLNKLNDSLPGVTRRVLLSEQDLLKCEVEIKKLRLEILKCFQSFSPLLLKRLLNNPVLAYSVIVKDKRLIDAVSAVRKQVREPHEMLWRDLKDPYMIAAMQFSI